MATKREKVFKKTNGRCFYCNGIAQHVDHYVSKAKWKEWLLESTPLKGGLNKLENLIGACRKCNIKKSDMPPENFIGNSYIAWTRINRANRRTGLPWSLDPNELGLI